MQPMYYIGLDVHKKKISYCVKDGSGKVHSEGAVPATRLDLDLWMKRLPQPWTAAMEATLFTGWIYDHLKPHATALKVGKPVACRASTALWRLGRLPGSKPGYVLDKNISARSCRVWLVAVPKPVVPS